MTDSLLKGAWLGLCIAAPVGPIGLLVIKRSFSEGRAAGLASGLGAALADLFYGILAVIGVRFAGAFARPVAFIGGLLLLWLAWRAWRERPAGESAAAKAGGLLTCVATTFALTISNPMTILFFAAAVSSAGGAAPVWFVAGVFSGSMLWWCILSSSANWLGQNIGIRGVWLNRIAAITLASFGGWAIWSKGLH
jgi:threonine/homoserine/homoserine lactone efflux protein